MAYGLIAYGLWLVLDSLCKVMYYNSNDHYNKPLWLMAYGLWLMIYPSLSSNCLQDINPNANGLAER
jgi:nitric oxide reductase large subunit